MNSFQDDAGRAGDNLIEGRNAVSEAIRAGVSIDKVFIAAGGDAGLGRLRAAAKAKGIVVSECDRRKLDAISVTGAHQGVIASASACEYAEIEDILKAAEASGRPALIVVCDGISDPHNLGAIIRAASCAGAHGVIIPKRRSSGVTPVCAKASAGAVYHIPIARVVNITAALETLKKAGLWIFGTAADAEVPMYLADLKGPAAIVIGGEGEGIGRLVAENCDFLVSIPILGPIESLNAHAAAAIILYEAVRQRGET